MPCAAFMPAPGIPGETENVRVGAWSDACSNIRASTFGRRGKSACSPSADLMTRNLINASKSCGRWKIRSPKSVVAYLPDDAVRRRRRASP